MNRKVLILGNGISRLQPSVLSFINAWDGELWGCNRVYLEHGHRLTCLTGHSKVLEEAEAWREQNGARFEIWYGHLDAGRATWQRFTCPVAFRKDSGTTLVTQALHEQRAEILCAGFDLGGPDIGSPGLDRQDKSIWVERWRRLALAYGGMPTVRFIGHDHLPFIMSTEPRRAYSWFYLNGKPHITDPEYIEVFRSFARKAGIPA